MFVLILIDVRFFDDTAVRIIVVLSVVVVEYPFHVKSVHIIRFLQRSF